MCSYARVNKYTNAFLFFQGNRKSHMERSKSDTDLTTIADDSPRGLPDRWSFVKRVAIGSRPYSPANDSSASATVQKLHTPSVNCYAVVKRKLAERDLEWILLFLVNNGLDILLETLEKLCENRTTSFNVALLQVDCVECIRGVMNSQSGLDYIIDNQEFTRKLAAGKIIFRDRKWGIMIRIYGKKCSVSLPWILFVLHSDRLVQLFCCQSS